MFVRIIVFMLLLDRRRFRPSSVFGTTKSLDSELWLTKVRFRPPAITDNVGISGADSKSSRIRSVVRPDARRYCPRRLRQAGTWPSLCSIFIASPPNGKRRRAPGCRAPTASLWPQVIEETIPLAARKARCVEPRSRSRYPVRHSDAGQSSAWCSSGDLQARTGDLRTRSASAPPP